MRKRVHGAGGGERNGHRKGAVRCDKSVARYDEICQLAAAKTRKMHKLRNIQPHSGLSDHIRDKSRPTRQRPATRDCAPVCMLQS